MSAFKNSWKKILLSNPELDQSNKYLSKIKDLSDPRISFETSFDEISKNPGIALICLDPTESFIQLLHHCHVVGGSWSNPKKTLVSILGTDKSAKPVQLILKSIKQFKAKTVVLEKLMGEENPNIKQRQKQQLNWNFISGTSS
jgi:hypothetical protein